MTLAPSGTRATAASAVGRTLFTKRLYDAADSKCWAVTVSKVLAVTGCKVLGGHGCRVLRRSRCAIALQPFARSHSSTLRDRTRALYVIAPEHLARSTRVNRAVRRRAPDPSIAARRRRVRPAMAACRIELMPRRWRRSPAPPAAPRRRAGRSAPAAPRPGRSCEIGPRRTPADRAATGRTAGSSGYRRRGIRRARGAAARSLRSRVLAPDDQFRQHRVVEHRHVETGLDAAVDAHARSRRLAQAENPPGRGEELVVGIFRVDPAFDGVTVRHEQAVRIDGGHARAARPARSGSASAPDRRPSPFP